MKIYYDVTLRIELNYSQGDDSGSVMDTLNEYHQKLIEDKGNNVSSISVAKYEQDYDATEEIK